MPVKPTRWVLIAEKDAETRIALKGAFEAAFAKEVKIIEADDGALAMTKIKKQLFHLVITDLELPNKSGEQIIEALRNGGFNETTPIITLSDKDNDEIEKKFAFVNFVKKPVNIPDFMDMVRNIFAIGSTENMISASIFSSLLESSLGFLEEALKRQDFEVGEMELKKRGDVLEAEHAAIIKVLVGKVSNTFSVLCSQKTLEELRNGSEKISGSSLEVICRSLGFVILKHVLTECGIIDSNEVEAKDITQDPSVLTAKQGILVPIRASNIDYQIFATTKSGDS